MENQNLNNVEQNQNTGKPQKSGNGKTVALVVILLILMLVIGLLGGMMLSDKGITFINQKQEEVKDKEENKTTKSEENEKDEDKTNKTENNVKNETKNNNSSSNTNTNTQTSTETIWYTSNVFKIKLPKSWENKYVVEMADGGNGEGDVYNFKTSSDNELLFSIELRKNEINDDIIPREFLGTYVEGNDLRYVYMTERTDAPVNAEPYTSMMKAFETYKDDVYVKQTFGNKTFYAKDFLQIEKGSMYRYYRYYIDEQDRLCILNYEKDVTIEIVASDVDKLTYDENENVIHAYPIGKSFVNNIARDVEEIVFENIN